MLGHQSPTSSKFCTSSPPALVFGEAQERLLRRLAHGMVSIAGKINPLVSIISRKHIMECSACRWNRKAMFQRTEVPAPNIHIQRAIQMHPPTFTAAHGERTKRHHHISQHAITISTECTPPNRAAGQQKASVHVCTREPEQWPIAHVRSRQTHLQPARRPERDSASLHSPPRIYPRSSSSEPP